MCVSLSFGPCLVVVQSFIRLIITQRALSCLTLILSRDNSSEWTAIPPVSVSKDTLTFIRSSYISFKQCFEFLFLVSSVLCVMRKEEGMKMLVNKEMYSRENVADADTKPFSSSSVTVNHISCFQNNLVGPKLWSSSDPVWIKQNIT